MIWNTELHNRGAGPLGEGDLKAEWELSRPGADEKGDGSRMFSGYSVAQPSGSRPFSVYDAQAVVPHPPGVRSTEDGESSSIINQ